MLSQNIKILHIQFSYSFSARTRCIIGLHRHYMETNIHINILESQKKQKKKIVTGQNNRVYPIHTSFINTILFK